MSVLQGRTHTPNAVTERVLAIVSALPTDEFGVRDVRARDSTLKGNQIVAVLQSKTRQRALDRVGRNRYRKGGIRIKTTLPLGIVAEAVWAALFTNTDQKPLRLAEIVGDAESFVGRPGVSLYRVVASTLTVWHRTGHLERTGSRGEYRYRPQSGVTQRPPVPNNRGYDKAR